MSKEKDWSKIASDFDERQERIVGKATTEIIKTKLNSELNQLGKVIEFGCGNGGYTKLITDKSDSIIATDCSEDMLQVAKEKLKKHTNIEYELADCTSSAHPEESFDTVFMANLIHVLSEPSKAIKEAKRILKPKGQLVIISFTMDGMTKKDLDSMIERYLEQFGPPPKLDKPMLLSDLNTLLIENGFRIKKSELIGADTKAMFVIASA